MNLDILQNTIEELECSETTFFNCQNLAHLYIVREYYKPRHSSLLTDTEQLTKELSDIFPQYRKYIDSKRNYQLHKISQEEVIYNMKILCKEIQEFIIMLYTNSDCTDERKFIKEIIQNVSRETV